MYKTYIPNENLLFPPNLGDFIPAAAPCRLLSNVVEQLDLRDVHNSYSRSSDGQPPYHPVMLMKVVLYGYMNNIFSSRGLEEAMLRDVHLIWLSSYQFPEQSTISRFKARCEPYIKNIFSSLVFILARNGEIKLSEDLYIDGTTIRSRASRRKIRWRGKLTAIRKACDRKESHVRTLEQCNGRCGVAPSDPDCGIMHAKEDGYDGMATPNYNVQIATQRQYVTNFGIYNQPDDKSVAMDFVNTCVKENGIRPSAVVEDVGYGCEEVYVGLEELEIEAVVKYPNYDRESSRRPVKEGQYDKLGLRLSDDESALVCPTGHTLRVLNVVEDHTRSGFRSDITVMTCDHHNDCPFKSQCTLAKNKHGEIRRKLGNVREEQKARLRLDKPENRLKLKRRSVEPELGFGQLKYNHGYTRFRHFGNSKVTMDLGFLLMAMNITKWHKNMKKAA